MIYLGSSSPSSFIGADGLPEVHLVEQDYSGRTIMRFCHDGTGKLATATDRRLRAAGLWAIELRGLGYHRQTNLAGDFRPGRRVNLIREPNNPHDPDALGVAAAGSSAVVGYFNKQAAKRFSKMIDAGTFDLDAVTIEGDGPGGDGRVVVLVAEPRLIAHVFGPRPADAAKPAH